MFLIVLFIKILTLQILLCFINEIKQALLASENCFGLAVTGWHEEFLPSLAENSESQVEAPKGRAWPFLHLGSWEMYFAAYPPHPAPAPTNLSRKWGAAARVLQGFLGSGSWALCSQRLFHPGKAQPPPFLSVWEWVIAAPPRPPRAFLVWAWYWLLPGRLSWYGRGRRRKPRRGEQKCGIPLLSSLACQAALLTSVRTIYDALLIIRFPTFILSKTARDMVTTG